MGCVNSTFKHGDWIVLQKNPVNGFLRPQKCVDWAALDGSGNIKDTEKTGIMSIRNTGKFDDVDLNEVWELEEWQKNMFAIKNVASGQRLAFLNTHYPGITGTIALSMGAEEASKFSFDSYMWRIEYQQPTGQEDMPHYTIHLGYTDSVLTLKPMEDGESVPGITCDNLCMVKQKPSKEDGINYANVSWFITKIDKEKCRKSITNSGPGSECGYSDKRVCGNIWGVAEKAEEDAVWLIRKDAHLQWEAEREAARKAEGEIKYGSYNKSMIGDMFSDDGGSEGGDGSGNIDMKIDDIDADGSGGSPYEDKTATVTSAPTSAPTPTATSGVGETKDKKIVIEKKKVIDYRWGILLFIIMIVVTIVLYKVFGSSVPSISELSDISTLITGK